MIGWFDLNDVLRRIPGFQRCLRRDELIVVSGIYIIDPVIRIIHLGIGKFRSGIRENAEGLRKLNCPRGVLRFHSVVSPTPPYPT